MIRAPVEVDGPPDGPCRGGGPASKAMLFLLGMTICVCGAAGARFYWQRFTENTASGQKGFFLPWALKGLLTPMVIWAVLNCGLLPGLPPLLPEIDAAIRQMLAPKVKP